MIRFYISYAPEAVKLLFTGWNILPTALSILSTILIGINKTLAEKFTSGLEGISPLYAFIPAGLVVMYGLLRANYNRFKTTDNQLDTVRQEMKELRARTGKVVLSNRDALVRAVSDVAQLSTQLLIRKREVNQSKEISPYAINTEVTIAEQKARSLYVKAMEVLHREKLVAGYAFREPISDFIVCILEQLEESSNLRPEDVSGVAHISLKAEETVHRIDGILSGQEPKE